MLNWADQLIEEYIEGRRALSKMMSKLNPEILEEEKDILLINSMIRSMSEAMLWLETGRDPKVMKGIHVNSVYQAKSMEMELIPDIAEQLESVNERPLYLTKEEKVLLGQIFSSFSEREKECYLLYEGHQKSMNDIAIILGLKKRTVQQYIERARAKVEEVVGKGDEQAS